MVARIRNSNMPKRSVVAMAVRAVEDDRVIDIPVTGVDPSPGALDLPEMEQPCSRCGGPAMGRCPTCGSPACEDCVAGDKC
jgi:hypothetical protein